MIGRVESLLRLGLKPVDAQHVFVATRQGCTVFLTCDGGVLARADDVGILCNVAVRKPSMLVANEAW